MGKVQAARISQPWLLSDALSVTRNAYCALSRSEEAAREHQLSLPSNHLQRSASDPSYGTVLPCSPECGTGLVLEAQKAAAVDRA